MDLIRLMREAVATPTRTASRRNDFGVAKQDHRGGVSQHRPARPAVAMLCVWLTTGLGGPSRNTDPHGQPSQLVSLEFPPEDGGCRNTDPHGQPSQ